MDLMTFLRNRLDEDEAILSVRASRAAREVEAKRRIVDRVEDCPHPPRVGGWCADCDGFLRLLAAIYSNHPDYDPGWK